MTDEFEPPDPRLIIKRHAEIMERLGGMVLDANTVAALLYLGARYTILLHPDEDVDSFGIRSGMVFRSAKRDLCEHVWGTSVLTSARMCTLCGEDEKS